MISATGEILELFSPQLDEEGLASFNGLIQRIGCAFPNYRSQLVQNELDAFQVDTDNIENVKYAAWMGGSIFASLSDHTQLRRTSV